ncbi:CPBP family glutamic-type intramembrane protease [Clostridium sp. MB40-C1]|uniref:CPBP family glutamic-type intramembrane protease n=1 Tax=Clostridium sp. MB40-C1 TaxID=3070996 RepID=UPI0027E18724|nr:CPBP family glutamic-type intramembrane protease [Clostridium sp. MB40-C1]WMJ81573.1 CPBP family glutamic-type intramembrane protease [Clostridium sp. MB40-C1]
MINLGSINIKSSDKKKSTIIGWGISLVLFIIAIIIYILSIKFTLLRNDGLFQYRAWNWMEYFLGICSLVVISIRFREIKLRTVICGLFFAFLCWISFFYRTTEIDTTIIDGLITFLAYIAGCSLRNTENGVRSLANEGEFKNAVKSLLYGCIVSILFACINVVYFVVTQDSIKLQNPLISGFLALQPGIGEEIVFRFFIINATLTILRNKLSQKHLLFVVMFLGVIPHSILHFPDLWLDNIPNAVFMLVSTSLMFGFPMAYIQYKRNLESAIGFHWFIDFFRFFVGF